MLEYDLKSMESFESTCKFFNQISRDHFCWQRYYSLNYTSSYRDLTAFENILKVENWKRQYRLYENRKNSLAGESENNSNSNSGSYFGTFNFLFQTSVGDESTVIDMCTDVHVGIVADISIACIGIDQEKPHGRLSYCPIMTS